MSALLQNHIAAVTGAGSGIGRAIALGFAREDATLAVLDLNGEAAEETAGAIRADGGKDGVRVNAIGPGFIETPLNAGTRANHPEFVKVFLDHTPLGRAGKPEDIVGPAIFLASDLSAYVTSSIVMADGGYRAV